MSAKSQKNSFAKPFMASLCAAVIGFFVCVFLANFFAAVNSYNAAVSHYQSGELLTKPSKAEYLTPKFSYFYTIPTYDKTLALIVMGAAGIGAFVFYRTCLSQKRRDAAEGVEGTDRWATTREIKKNFYAVDENKLDKAKKTGIVVAYKHGKYYVDPTTTHSFVVGTTRSGKTQTFVLPMIRLMSRGIDKQSFIVNDPKGELLENSYDFLKQNGYNIVVLNLRETDKSSLWNPLTFIIQKYKQARDNNLDLSKVNEYLDVMIEVLTQNTKSDPIWPSSAKSLLTAMILYLMELGYENNTLDKVNMYSVYQFFIEYGVTEQEVLNGVAVETTRLDKLFQSLPRGNPAKAAYATSNFAKGEMKSSIFATLSENMALFGRDMGIAALTSGDDIDFIKLFGNEETPTAIFMIIPDNRPARHSVASMFINQAYLSLCEYLDDNEIKRLPRTVNFILDEFANMVTIPDMAAKITVSAARGIIFHLFVQSLQQVESKYGKDAKTIMENCGNTVYIYSLAPETNEYFSKLLGSSTLQYETYSGTVDEGMKNKSYHFKAKPLKSPTELSVLSYGETIIKHQRMYPILTKFGFFYKLGLKVTPISEIPLSDSRRALSDWLFPFELIDEAYSKACGSGVTSAGAANDIPNIPLVSPDSHAKREYKSGKNPTSPVKLAIEQANRVTNNEFSELLAARDFRQLKALLNQLKFKRQLSEQSLELLSNIVENEKNR